MEPSPSNTRYILELEREELIKQRTDFDEKYGTWSFIFLQTFQTVAIVAYLFIVFFLTFTKKIRSKTNLIVAVWAFINLIVLCDRSVRFLFAFVNGEDNILINGSSVCQMLAGLGRLYGTSLIVVWLYLKYFETPNPRYNLLLYFLILLPALVCAYFLFYYYNVDMYIYEVFGPGCDIVSVATYLLVGFIFGLCKIFVTTERSCSAYPLLMSLSNLITNLPIGLITIYVRFNLDISWSYRFHVHFVDLFINLFTASNGFAAVFLVLLYHRCLHKILNKKVKYFDCEDDKSDWF